METFIHSFKINAEYERLLSALGLHQDGPDERSFFTEICGLLDVRMSQLSDCIRRGHVTEPILEAAKAKGINPNYIKTGKLPVHLE